MNILDSTWICLLFCTQTPSQSTMLVQTVKQGTKIHLCYAISFQHFILFSRFSHAFLHHRIVWSERKRNVRKLQLKRIKTIWIIRWSKLAHIHRANKGNIESNYSFVASLVCKRVFDKKQHSTTTEKVNFLRFSFVFHWNKIKREGLKFPFYLLMRQRKIYFCDLHAYRT